MSATWSHSLKSNGSISPIVACGIGNDSNAAVDAIKGGAKEYVPLPPDPELIAAVLEAVSQESNAIIHADPAMKQVLAFADKIAPAVASALITGQSGTGKELMARYIHVKSKRSTNNFVAVNCAAIPENLLESELFGHEKGAFTGAVARRIGKFEEANGGTLLLDEISEMHVRLQAKLLRAIQEREIDRVGGTQPIKVDVRIVATSNRNLEAEVKNGEFREDLFFRLNVIEIKLPSLRERPKDILVLANFFAEKYAEANGVDRLPIGTQAMDLLLSHAWRGNVRELENTMHRAVLLAQGNEIGTEAIVLSGGGQDEVASVAAAAAAGRRRRAVERAGGGGHQRVGRQRGRHQQHEVVAPAAARVAAVGAAGEALDDAPLFLEADLCFHMAVARATQNTLLVSLLEATRGYLQEWIKRSLAGEESEKDRARLSHEQHVKIVVALRRRDGDAARTAMVDHVLSSSQDLRAYFPDV